VALIRLKGEGATLYTALEIGSGGQGKSLHPSNWRISFTMELADPAKLQLASGENVSDVRFILNAQRMTDDLRNWLQAQSADLYGNEFGITQTCGVLQFFSATESTPATVFLTAYLSTDDMEELVGLVRDGLLPEEVTVETVGFVYDWRLDSNGGGYRWDNVSSPRAGIKQFGFSIPVTGPGRAATISRSSPDIPAVADGRIVTLLQWILAALLLIALAVMIRL
jgi:hypothetical protein